MNVDDKYRGSQTHKERWIWCSISSFRMWSQQKRIESVLFYRGIKREPSNTHILLYLWGVNHSRSPRKRLTTTPIHTQILECRSNKPSLYSWGIFGIWIRRKPTHIESSRSYNYWHHSYQILSYYHPLSESQPLSLTHKHAQLSQDLTEPVLLLTPAPGLHPNSSLSSYRL